MRQFLSVCLALYEPYWPLRLALPHPRARGQRNDEALRRPAGPSAAWKPPREGPMYLPTSWWTGGWPVLNFAFLAKF